MKTKEIFQYSFAALFIIGFFAVLFVLLAKPIPTENKDTMNLVVGALLGAVGTIVAFFYGSSMGSARKTELLNANTNPA